MKRYRAVPAADRRYEDCVIYEPDPTGPVVMYSEAARLEQQVEALKAFYNAFQVADSNRGCYSCTPEHDCRCELDRKISKTCTCGRAELDEAEDAVEAADARAREVGAIE